MSMPFRETALKALATVAAVVAIGGGGYALVNAIGWEKTLGIIGFEVTTVQSAPDSQCNRAREQVGQGDDTAIACISDREWLKRFVASCAAGDESNLAFVDTDGALTSIGTCPEEWRAGAKEMASQPIPDGYRVADAIAAAQ